MRHSYDGICFDLFGTLVEDGGDATVGAALLLQRLANSRIAIVTSASRRTALAMLRAAGLHAPAVVVCGDDVERGKPAPDPYALAVASLGIMPARALAVEDTASGVQSAKSAGLDAAYLMRGRPASTCPQADFYLRSLLELRLDDAPDQFELGTGRVFEEDAGITLHIVGKLE